VVGFHFRDSEVLLANRADAFLALEGLAPLIW
jgi:hypothetical protein